MENQTFKMSQKGYDQLVEELKYLQTVREKEVAEQLKKARSFGDLSENPAYDEAKTEQGRLYSKIAEIKKVIDIAEIIAPAPQMIKCRTFEDVMQDYTVKTELSELSEGELPEEVKYFMRRLIGHELSSGCQFVSDTEDYDTTWGCGGQIYSSGTVIAQVGAGGNYYVLRPDGMVCYFDHLAEGDARYKHGDAFESLDYDVLQAEIAQPLGISFAQFVVALDLYAQFQKVYAEYEEESEEIDHFLGECSDDCKGCRLVHQFRQQLDSIEKNLSENWV